MAFASPHADVEASALSVPYAPPALPSNTLAAPAPATWLPPRAAPRAELAAVLETVALHGLGASAAVVLAALWSWSNADGLAWPCVESIARRASVSRRTAFSALAQLENAGLIVRQVPALRARRVRRESTTYRVPTPRDAQPALPLAELVAVKRSPAPRPPRRVAPRSTPPVAPSPEPRAGRPAPQPGAAPAEHQVQPPHPKGPEGIQTQNARADAQVRATPAPPGDPRPTSPAAPSAELVAESTVSKRMTRAERSAANRAAWAARPRTTPSSRPLTARRAPSPRSFVAPRSVRSPDPEAALATLRAWRDSLQLAPPMGERPEPVEHPPTPAQPARQGDPARGAPAALGRLLEPFARPDGERHGRRDGSTPAPRPGAAGPSPSPLRAIDTSSARARPEGRATPLWSPHPSR